MHGRDRDARRASADEDWDPDWEEDRDEPARPRRGVLRRLAALMKFVVFAAPLALFAYGSLFADCRSGAGLTGWSGFLGASACARSAIAGSTLTMQDNFAILKRLID